MKKMCFILFLAFTSVANAQTTTPIQPSGARVAPPQPVEGPRVEAPKPPENSKPVAQPTKLVEPLQPIGQPAKQSTFPSLLRPDPISFNARLGMGPAFSPSAFWLDATIEAQLDKFVALGPKFQYGSNADTDFFFTSFGPRFTVPFSYFEIGVNAGCGFAYRNVNAFEFNNFLYEAGFNLDLYLFQNFSVGIAYNANFLTSAAETFMSALLFSASAHF